MRHMTKKASPIKTVAPLRSPNRVYTPSQYAVRKAQEEARDIPYRNRERVKNEVLPREAETLRNRWSAPLFEIWRGTKVHKPKNGVEENPWAWVGSYVDSGAYGMVFTTVVNQETLDNMMSMRKAMTNRMFDALPPVGSTIAIKLARQADFPMDVFVKMNVKESAVHARLSNAPCVTLPDTTRPLCVAENSPRFYFSGLIVATNPLTDRPAGVFVTVMNWARGTSLKDWKLTGTAEEYVQLERAACAMWVNGVIHGDFHKGNIKYDAASNKAIIIDFGFGALLPPSGISAIRGAISTGVKLGVRSLGESWRTPERSQIGTRLLKYSNRVQHTRIRDWFQGGLGGPQWYNPDGHALLRIFSQLPAAQRARVPALRRAVWGSTAAASAPPIPTSRQAAPSRLSKLKSRSRRRTTTVSESRGRRMSYLQPVNGTPVNGTPMNVNTPGPRVDRQRAMLVARTAASSLRKVNARVVEQSCRKRGLRFNSSRGRCVR